MSRKPNKRGSAARRTLTALCIVLALVLSVLLVACVYLDRVLSLVGRLPQTVETLSPEELHAIENQTDEVDENFTGPFIDPTDITWDADRLQSISGDHLISILLIGQDRRPGESRQRSDAMILCTVNTETKTLTMTSFLRDLYVQIPGYQDNRLNAAYAIGGMPLLDETLQQNFGIRLDGNIEVDFSQFEQIVELVGGVDITLTSAEAAHLNKTYGYSLHEGLNHLNGEETLSYSRIRYIGTDFGRTDRQRAVLNAILDQSRNMALSELIGLMERILGLVSTDMTDAQILGYVMTCFPMLGEISVQTQHIPAEGTYSFASVRGMSVIVADMQENRQILVDSLLG